jgi:sn-glycerol 3-phosphate transport system substrate-binding protein
VILVAMAVLLAACGGGDSDDGAAPDGNGKPELPNCPLDALASAPKPVKITYWHAMTSTNKEELEKLTARFNAEQRDVQVTLSGAASYADNFTRFKAGLGTRNLPDLIQGEETTLQSMIDSRAVLPAAACLAADGADTSDLVGRIAAYYSIEGVLYPMPFNNSNPILYYNKLAFEKAGLDPEKPPRTLEEVRAASQKLVQSRTTDYGIALKTDSWIIEHWLAKAGHTILDNGNGRSGRATSVTFGDDTGIGIFRWIDEMVESKLALSTGTADLDHYFAVGEERAAMTIDTSAALGRIMAVFEAGQFTNVELGAGALPGPESPDGGVLVGGAANYILNRSAPEKQAAAYRFARFLVSSEAQSQWAAGTGYTPVSKRAVTIPPISERYAAQPEFKVAYDQLLAAPDNDATAGPVLGAYGARSEGLRGAIVDALSRMLHGDLTPEEAVDSAVRKANAAIAEYNSRVG